MIDHILTPLVVEALGWTLLHSLWQGAAFAILLVLILIALRSYTAQSRYIVSVGLLCAFFLTVSATFWLQWQEASSSLAYASQQLNTQHLDDVIVNMNADIVLSSEVHGKSNLSVKEQASLRNQSSLLLGFRDYYSRHLPLLVTIWFVGILFLQLRFLGQLAYVQRLKHYGTQMFPSGWTDKIEELEGKLRIQKKVNYLTSFRIDSPMVIGWLKPVVLLPQQLFNSLSETEIYTVLAHELAHIRREDFVINLMQTFLCNVFFFHPGVWWMSHQIDDEREHCCDDLAVAATGPATTYAKTLINVSELQLRMQGHTQLAMALSGKSNKRERGGFSGRIRRLFRVNSSTGAFKEGFATACILIAAVFFGIAATGSTVQDNDVIGSSGNENMEISLKEDVTNLISNNETIISNRTSILDDQPISQTNKTIDQNQLPIASLAEQEKPVNVEEYISSNETRIDALVMACAEGDLDFVKTLVSSGIDVNGLGSEGFTPLMMAASEDKSQIVEYLIKAGADVDQTYNGWNALIEAADEGSLASLEYLLKAGAKVNYYSAKEGQTAIGMAASEGHLDCLKLLLANGANINGIGQSFPPLHAAAEEGESTIVDFLIVQKVNINKQDASGRTALMYAAEEGEELLMKKLISAGADISITDLYGNDARDLIEEEDSNRRVDLSGVDKPDIHQATLNGLIEKVQRMVEQGVDVNSRDSDGQTPLHLAASKNHTIDMRVLMELGANINLQDNDGRTPMMYAAANGKRDAVVLLVSQRANVNIIDNDGMRAYEWARFGRNTEIKKFLGLITENVASSESKETYRFDQSNRTNVNEEGSYEKRKQEQEKRYQKLKQEQEKRHEKSLKHNMKKELRTDDHIDVHTNKHIDTYIHNHTDVHQNTPKKETFHVRENGTSLRQFDIEDVDFPLLEAAQNGSVNDCNKLLSEEGIVNLSDDTGQTALMVASRNNRLDVAELLIANGADVNMSSTSGLTALHYAALENHDQMAKLLLENNARVDPTMHYSSTDGNYSKEPLVWEYIGATPLLIAVESGNVDVLSILIDAGANTKHTLIRNEYRLNKDRNTYLDASEVTGLDQDFLKEVEFKKSDDSWTPYKQALLLNEEDILEYFKN